MKRGIFVTAALGLAVALVGCSDSQSPTGGTSATTNSGEASAGSSEFTLVNLKVPNMT